MVTAVVNLRKSEYLVYIGRGSKWGNPFHIGKDGSRDEVIVKYAQYISGELANAAMNELKDKLLGCFCSPEPCHGDVLADIANGGDLMAWIPEDQW